MTHQKFLQQTIRLAKKSLKEKRFPCGALVVSNGKVIGKGMSSGKHAVDPTAHAEICAIRMAGKKTNGLLKGLFCTLLSSPV